ncbi:phosphopantothenoylcysteine decarboxylase/phosphopantothenate--cysteine ligase [Sinobacterium caligoides]|uniref:Coenzyme A biosynthesis bifunctional protein CoaBC n=1 Tax=Sinobacterium caligoides TaxID=933926 RepID=A0A3N2DH45_9GAMM|nr:bifunctional phosphopantothenoylcysteine decarboxylase/phosphopantothenate--cysteine ligase CoaBC [Sinobacterium caligoides]ROR99102.1 phosphopantothenoylcysteine decarboxylase/phosphopantothenate--cysteine ligase [Sinobacterium caligoides]
MKQLTNKNILVGVSGGIAAYKSAELIRLFKKAGANVQVIMTAAAMEFITPLTLQALSGNPVHHSLLDPEAEAAMGHIELARWADCIVIAPATADLLSQLSLGSAGTLLSTVVLASSAPIIIAPAMNQAMWRDPATQHNCQQLRSRGMQLIGPNQGEQACGDTGPGRMLEAEEIATSVAAQFQSRSLDGLRVVITAGPTREALDPVRYISNHSSGKMGFSIAAAAAEAGAITTVIAGPVHLSTPDSVHRIDVTSASEMCAATLSLIDDCDIFIATAAVADYRPVSSAEQKIKKTTDTLNITLIKNVDIVSTVAARDDSPFTVGFAAETQDVERYARDKMQRKKLDMIIANDVANSDIGFNSNDNAVTIFSKCGDSEAIAQTSKQQLGRLLIAKIATKVH